MTGPAGRWLPVAFGVAGALCGGRAWAGSFDGEVGVDGFVATSKSAETGAGQPESMSAWELGLRARARLLEVDDRLEVVVDYRGREPLGGAFPNDPLRLLYRLDARFDVIASDVTWNVGVGRFVAPSVVFLPVDGVRTEVSLAQGLSFEAFGGRRAITTSRRNVPFSRFLPAVGGAVRFVRPWMQAEALGAWARDEVPLVSSGEEVVETWDAFNASVSVRVSPFDTWSAGGRLVIADRATYTLGPTWSEVALDVKPGFYSGHLFGRWRPVDAVLLDLDLLGQQVGVARAGTDYGGEAVDDVLPSFVDTRLRAGFRPGSFGWIRPEVRLRVRPDRTEIRWGGGVEALDLGVPGLFVKGRLYVEHLFASSDPKWTPAVDRLSWSASAGWNWKGFDGEIGASAIERAANPVSGRRADPGEPTLPERSEDLGPFVMETNEIAFLRAFYGARWWYVGVDVEHSLLDAEWRAMLQIGALGRTSW